MTAYQRRLRLARIEPEGPDHMAAPRGIALACVLGLIAWAAIIGAMA